MNLKCWPCGKKAEYIFNGISICDDDECYKCILPPSFIIRNVK